MLCYISRCADSPPVRQKFERFGFTLRSAVAKVGYQRDSRDHGIGHFLHIFFHFCDFCVFHRSLIFWVSCLCQVRWFSGEWSMSQPWSWESESQRWHFFRGIVSLYGWFWFLSPLFRKWVFFFLQPLTFKVEHLKNGKQWCVLDLLLTSFVLRS